MRREGDGACLRQNSTDLFNSLGSYTPHTFPPLCTSLDTHVMLGVIKIDTVICTSYDAQQNEAAKRKPGGWFHKGGGRRHDHPGAATLPGHVNRCLCVHIARLSSILCEILPEPRLLMQLLECEACELAKRECPMPLTACCILMYTYG